MDDEVEKLREELAEANARREDLRTALEWACKQRDEAIKARDQYLRERDQARLAEERARESLDELDEAIYECLPSDDDDAPLDCVERAADQLRALRKERDEARAAAFAEAIAAVYGALDYNHGFPPHLDAIHEGVRFAALVLERHVTNADPHQSNAVRAVGVAQIIRERDEARAEVATAAKYCDELAETIRMHVAREIELEAEVERLRNAFRRGAEAMRKQVMDWLVQAQAEATVIVVDTAIRGVHKLPIPEER